MYNECLRRDAEKMALIEELGFGAFSHLTCYNLKQHMLKELVNIYDIHDNTIHSVHGDVEITTDKIGKALGLSWNGDPFDDKVSEKDLNDEDHAIFKMFQGKSQAELTMLVKRTPVDTEANQNLFKRAFLIFIQKVFLLPTSSPNVTPKALPTLFGLENTRGRNWALYVHDFLLEEIKKAKLNNTKGLVKTGLLRTAKDKLLKRNRELKMGINIMRKYPYSSESEQEFDSEDEYESEVESSSGGSSSSSSEMDLENTMSEELVERRALPNPTPAQQERRSKKKQDSSATGPQAHPQPQQDRAAKKAKKATPDDPVESASGNAEETPQGHPSPQSHPERTPTDNTNAETPAIDEPQPQPPVPQQQLPAPQYEDLIDISSSSEDEN
ncbi:hypothetical protein PIB30_028821 [Stylosanthes scabra]|uniref:Uncharacterized protein n=1 Tax=Stylosanthes scabra TaxID=79078 RepID=A0ABU6TBU7_9FABA|nr:hypothetical protein [Stylosanthes scabra]